jgi:predicted amidophosphoribosyltransferase
VVVLAAYADDVRSAVLAAKRPGGELPAAGLATLLARKHASQIAAWNIDLIVPVPMHWTRRMLRGTSAADGVARGVAAALDLPRRAALIRRRATRMQNELEPAARRANVRDAFRATAVVAGRRVLVVDDVTTTGGTLAACRQALVAAGAAAVYAAAVARADAAEPTAG